MRPIYTAMRSTQLCDKQIYEAIVKRTRGARTGGSTRMLEKARMIETISIRVRGQSNVAWEPTPSPHSYQTASRPSSPLRKTAGGKGYHSGYLI